MARLSVNTNLDSVVICGAFCDWSMDKAIRADRAKEQKSIVIKDMPVGEYRVFACKSFLSGEIYPSDGRQMSNRYFGGKTNEVISCYFAQ